MDEFPSNGTVVRKESGPWGRILDVDGLGTRRVVAFEREVAWLRVADTRVVVEDAHGAETSGGWSFSDSGAGFLSCLLPAIEAARSVARSKGLGPARPSAAKVRLLVRDLPCVAVAPGRGDLPGSAQRYVGIPRDWIAGGDHAFVGEWLTKWDIGQTRGMPPVRCVGAATVLNDVPAWSSACGRVGNSDLLERTVRAALAGLPASVVDADLVSYAPSLAA